MSCYFVLSSPEFGLCVLFALIGWMGETNIYIIHTGVYTFIFNVEVMSEQCLKSW